MERSSGKTGYLSFWRVQGIQSRVTPVGVSLFYLIHFPTPSGVGYDLSSLRDCCMLSTRKAMFFGAAGVGCIPTTKEAMSFRPFGTRSNTEYLADFYR